MIFVKCLVKNARHFLFYIVILKKVKPTYNYYEVISMLDEVLNAVGVKSISEINEPIVTVVGNKMVIIVNGSGLLSLKESRVEIKGNKSYKIVVDGDCLECGMFNKNEIQIEGRILNVSWERL